MCTYIWPFLEDISYISSSEQKETTITNVEMLFCIFRYIEQIVDTSRGANARFLVFLFSSL